MLQDLSEHLSLWHRALGTRVGLCISTNDRQLLRMQLYRARAEAQDPNLDRVVIFFPDPDDQIWLVRKDVASSK